VNNNWAHRFCGPALGADPLPPFPLNAALRASLVVVFVVYALAGQVRDEPALVGVCLGLVAAGVLGCEIAFRAAGSDRNRLFRTWAFVLPIDIVVVNAAAMADGNENSVIPMVTLATIFTASAMFRAPYLLGLTVLAASLTLGLHTWADLVYEDQVTFWGPGLSAVLLVATGAFSVQRGRAEERLRASLLDSTEREAGHARSLGRALEAARLSEARFMAFSEHAPAMLVLFDRDGQSTFASRHAERLFGDGGSSQPVELKGASETDLLRIQEEIRAAVAGAVTSVDYAQPDRTGTPRRMSGVFFPIEGGAGGIIIDVTRERALAAQVTRAQQMETLGTLAGGIAHDFNNLLTAILGNVYLARSTVDAESALAPYLDEARVAGERGAELVQRLLAYSRPGVDRSERVSLLHLVDETVKLASRGLTPSVELEVNAPCQAAAVEGNFSALQQVLLNLLVNARDAMPGGGRMRITCATDQVDDEAAAAAGLRPGPFHVIAVSDTGTGMSPETLSRIFDPFFTTKDVGKGSGLGLPTSLSIARAHGGALEVETAPGQGSTFRIMLPAAGSETAARPPQTGVA
jgi:signal transduction histidine kinase